jgi:peptide-methionine (S)-S-oxide reductase
MTNAPQPAAGYEQATLGGGCFWCLDAVFRSVKGVSFVESGYSNGSHPHPSYEAVCGGDTGHNEVVRLHFDPQQIDYRTILSIFFGVHDPTTLNRQGNDVGTQYRSGIYVHDEAQRQVAQELIAELEMQQVFDAPIVTEVVDVDNYHPAEDYHQRYFEKNPYQGYCAAVVAPKVSKFRRKFAAWLV